MANEQKRFQLLQGNEACVEGAIAAGMRFYAGYPITPSTEIAERSAVRLPQVGGKFMQMEDEIAGIAAALGASVAGMKAMTATSGPGFSLKQENIGYATIAEIPIVIVDVMRSGPSTGLHLHKATSCRQSGAPTVTILSLQSVLVPFKIHITRRSEPLIWLNGSEHRSFC